jgi:hypothetical protein
MHQTTPSKEFVTRFRGAFSGILKWSQFDALWSILQDSNDGGWYVYHVGEAPPDSPCSSEEFTTFLQHMNEMLRKEHAEDYCGVVYVDQPEAPTYIKIFDPNNLGVSCGYSDNPPLPGWIISRIAPVDLPNALPPAQNRKRWWRRIFRSAT